MRPLRSRLVDSRLKKDDSLGSLAKLSGVTPSWWLFIVTFSGWGADGVNVVLTRPGQRFWRLPFLSPCAPTTHPS